MLKVKKRSGKGPFEDLVWSLLVGEGLHLLDAIALPHLTAAHPITVIGCAAVRCGGASVTLLQMRLP